MTLLCASVHREKNKKRERERDKDLIKDNLVPACQATRDKLNASLPRSLTPSLPCSVRRRPFSSESKTQFTTVTMVSEKKKKKVGNYLPGVKDLSNRNKEDSEEMA